MAGVKLNDLFFFVQVVDRNGFAAASRELKIPKSSISKRIAELEKDLGARLIQRTTRSFTVTEAGQAFYRHAAAALLEAEAAEDAVRSRLAEPTGTVRITTSMTTVQMALADLLPRLAKHHPKVRVVLHVTNRFVDLVQEGFDVAVRAHQNPLPDSDLLQRRLGFSPNYLVASPDYVAEYGLPRTPEDIDGHFGIFADEAMQTRPSLWRLRGPDGSQRDIALAPRFFADDPATSLSAALSGLGVASLPHGLCWPGIERGALVRLLPDWDSGGATTTILTPHRRGQLPSVRAAVDFLADGLLATMAFR